MQHYLNPVYNHAFPDPFVLKFCGEYWAYCTGVWTDGRYFGILRSPDLVHWTPVGGAMGNLPGGHTCYWAPEVSYWNGRFYLYYSVGNETLMHIRVAVADHPAGPFFDSGHRLTTEDFAIDAHVFEDDDGARYLFYATDYLTHSHIGTGTAIDRLLDPFTLAGQPRPVTRARHDWQVYDPQRAEKGGVRWHTVEGSFVLKHKGRYYQMFSGGNWQNVSYGVSYAVTDDLNTPDEWQQVADGQRVLPILRTIPGQVIGPGHNSVVRGPDNQQLFCVYHRWAEGDRARVMCIDRLDWVGERMLALGPSTDAQPAPITPLLAGFHTEDDLAGWQVKGGRWEVREGALCETTPAGSAAICHPLPATPFVLEVSLRATGEVNSRGDYGVTLSHADGPTLAVTLDPDDACVLVDWQVEDGWREAALPLPDGFDARAFHLLCLVMNGQQVSLTLDEGALRWQGRAVSAPTTLTLRTLNLTAAFAGLASTPGWEDLFVEETTDIATLGWQAADAQQGWAVASGELRYQGAGDGQVSKGTLLDSYEVVVNARLEEAAGPTGRYGIYPALTADRAGPLLSIVEQDDEWRLVGDAGAQSVSFPLPGFNPFIHQQFRFRKHAGRLTIQWEAAVLGEIDVSAEPTYLGLLARGGAAFDMVRLTQIKP